MDWYYALGDAPVGPVSEEEFAARRADGTITDSTLVWHSGMNDWLPLGVAEGRHPPPIAELLEPHAASVEDAPIAAGEAETQFSADLAASLRCVSCGEPFAEADLIAFRGVHVCAACKPAYFQRMLEGADLPGTLPFAGFWVRAGAKMVDSILLLGLSLGGMLATGVVTANEAEDLFTTIFSGFMSIVQLAIGVAYTTYFVGAFGGTLGKMLFGIRVVRSDGSRVTYLRAFARFWAEYVSGMILYIGYFMAAFDSEKRALHDHMCDTRVITRRQGPV